MAGGDKGGALGPFFLATSTNSTAAAQIYNPASGTLGAFSLTTSALNTARESAASVVLPNGLTLIVGGEDCVPNTTYFGAVGFHVHRAPDRGIVQRDQPGRSAMPAAAAAA